MWLPFRRSNDRRLAAKSRQLVIESESFLGGSYPLQLRANGQPIPEWAWLSVLTHSPADLLLDQDRMEWVRIHHDRAAVIWQAALDLLIQELVTTSECGGRSVQELQHALIVDIELARPLGGTSARALGPIRFVRDVRQVLYRFRASPQG